VEVTIDIVRSGEQLLFYQDTKYADMDLIYIAYHLPKMNGMETAAALRKNGYVGNIVFYTEDPAHAREGYTVDALAYLLKNKERRATHEHVFLKALREYEQQHAERIMLSYHGEQIHIRIADILYFEVLNHTVTVHYLRDGKVQTFECYAGLNKFEKQLEGKGFLRVHKSYLISEQHVYKRFPDHLEMENGDIIPIGHNIR
jgi:DNA-binding LytR/AlgR family response regulator